MATPRTGYIEVEGKDHVVFSIWKWNF